MAVTAPSRTSPTTTPRVAQRDAYEPGPSLSKVASGDGMMRGHSGQGVKDLQKLLNDAGIKPALDQDGKLGPKTEAAIYKFQQQNGLRADGVVGKNTLKSLQSGARFKDGVGASGTQQGALNAPTDSERKNAPDGTIRAGELARNNPAGFRRVGAEGIEAGRSPGAFAGDSASREAQAERLMKANGMWPPQEGRTYAIQIDQDSPPGDASRADRTNFLRSYSGETAVFRGSGGALQEIAAPMASAAHPGQIATSQSPDVNGDGRSDIATLRAGAYEYSTRPTGSNRLNPTSNHAMQVARDVDGNGTISAAEDQFASQNQMYATGLQWHAGNSNRPSSIGCQTMAPGDFERFKNAVGSSGDGSFSYLLVRRDNDRFGSNPL